MKVTNQQAMRVEQMLTRIAGEKCSITRHHADDTKPARFEVRVSARGLSRLARTYSNAPGTYIINRVFVLEVKSFTSFESLNVVSIN